MIISARNCSGVFPDASAAAGGDIFLAGVVDLPTWCSGHARVSLSDELNIEGWGLAPRLPDPSFFNAALVHELKSGLHGGKLPLASARCVAIPIKHIAVTLLCDQSGISAALREDVEAFNSC